MKKIITSMASWSGFAFNETPLIERILSPL